MKKLLIMGALASISAMAADWTGYIVDKTCAAKDKAMWTNEACVKRCMGRGDPAVFVTEEGKIFAIAEQDKVKDFAGKKVSLSGTMKDDTISVESVKAM